MTFLEDAGNAQVQSTVLNGHLMHRDLPEFKFCEATPTKDFGTSGIMSMAPSTTVQTLGERGSVTARFIFFSLALTAQSKSWGLAKTNQSRAARR